MFIIHYISIGDVAKTSTATIIHVYDYMMKLQPHTLNRQTYQPFS